MPPHTGGRRSPGRVARSRLAALVAAAVLATAPLTAAAPAHAAGSIRSQQWYLDSWHIEEAWEISRGAGITVAIVDTGIDATHPDLVGQVVEAPLGEGDLGNHGTGMASLIAGTAAGAGGQGTQGVAPKAKVASYRSSTGAGQYHAREDIARAIRMAADSSARIISVSISAGLPNLDEWRAVSYALSRNKLVVASAGNLEVNGIGDNFPAAYPGVLGVSAIGRDGRLWDGSSRGPWVSLAAPGVDLVKSCVGGTGYCMGSGTSGATALVAGVAALVWSAHPAWTANQVIHRLIGNTSTGPGEQVPNNIVGFGIVSPRKALQSTAPPGPPDVNPLVGVRGNPPGDPVGPLPADPAPFPSLPPRDPPTTGPAATAPASAPAVPPTSQAAAPAPTRPPAQQAARADEKPFPTPAAVLITAGVVIAAAVIVTRTARRNRRAHHRAAGT